MSEGTVTEIVGQRLTVAVRCGAACEACAGRESCGMIGLPAKIVTVKVARPQDYRVGQKVTLNVKSATVGLSLFFAFILPTIWVVAALLLALYLGAGETSAAVWGLGAAVVYAVFLRLVNFWFDRHLKVTVE